MRRCWFPWWIGAACAVVLFIEPGGAAGQSALRAPEPDGNDARHGAAAVSWETIAANMQSAQTLLAAGDPGDVTQQRQQEVLAGLDAMIAAAEAASQRQPQSPMGGSPADDSPGDASGASGDAANPNAKESVERHGSETVEDPHAAGPRRTAAEEFWGHLAEGMPQRVRQFAGTKAVPKYQQAVEEYFQRLLESQDAMRSFERD
jgi:hypothetical protein